MAVTLDQISTGRAVLGVGAGWHEEEHAMFGIAFPPASERVDRLDEALRVIRALLATPDCATVDGAHHRLRQAYFRPRAPELPILVGGSGRRVRTAAAAHADVFNSFAAPDDWLRLNQELDGLVASAGRDPQTLARSAYVFAELSGDPAREAELLTHVRRRNGPSATDAGARTVLADPASAVRVLREFDVAGVGEVVLGLRPPYRVEHLERFASAVLPLLG
jgi:alkanesulfonate monooxygenase SsuD/methylene tetrahydromethanopterin reductase-like flavin-dependent oxidoreductase (luciferase family)